MGDGDLFSEPLFIARLSMPNPAPAHNLLSMHPRERWGKTIDAEVQQLAASPDTRVAEAARKALDA